MHSDAATLTKASIWHEASRIIREEGFRAFWKGNLVTVAHRLPYSSVNFYAYDHYKKVSMSILQIHSIYYCLGSFFKCSCPYGLILHYCALCIAVTSYDSRNGKAW